MGRGGRVDVARAPVLVEDAIARTFGVESIPPTQFACGRAVSPGPIALLAAVVTSELAQVS
jgi:hypothetical protein